VVVIGAVVVVIGAVVVVVETCSLPNNLAEASKPLATPRPATPSADTAITAINTTTKANSIRAVPLSFDLWPCRDLCFISSPKS
jgi:hypothetical protein